MRKEKVKKQEKERKRIEGMDNAIYQMFIVCFNRMEKKEMSEKKRGDRERNKRKG